MSRTMLITLPLPKAKHLNSNESNPWLSLAPIKCIQAHEFKMTVKKTQLATSGRLWGLPCEAGLFPQCSSVQRRDPVRSVSQKVELLCMDGPFLTGMGWLSGNSLFSLAPHTPLPSLPLPTRAWYLVWLPRGFATYGINIWNNLLFFKNYPDSGFSDSNKQELRKWGGCCSSLRWLSILYGLPHCVATHKDWYLCIEAIPAED